MKKKLIIVLVIISVIGTISFAFYKKRATEKKESQSVVIDTVKKGDITSVVEQTGIIKPQVGSQVKVGTRATGTLMKLGFQVGDRVKKGQLIALIDDRQIVADIDNAKANLAYAEQNLKLVKDTYPLKIKEQEAINKSLQSQTDYAAANLKRQQELYKKGFATDDEIERAKKEYDVSKSQLEQGLATLKRLNEEYQNQLSLAKASIEQNRARLKNLEVALSYTRIYAPISGIVSQVSTQEGEMVVSGLSTTNLITILDPTRLEIWIYIDETDIGKVKENMEVEYWVDAYRNKIFKGTITSIYPQPEVKDNIVYYLATVKVKPEDAIFLRPEMTVHAKIISERKKDVLLVPNRAIKFENGDYVVYVPKDGKKMAVKVKTGIRDESQTEILSGLKEGDQFYIETMSQPKEPKKK
ncbi:MAG: efflux RND transporter periplasmic adaptor subunit [bacterium]